MPGGNGIRICICGEEILMFGEREMIDVRDGLKYCVALHLNGIIDRRIIF